MDISVSFLFSMAAQLEAQGPSILLRAGFLYHILSPNWSGLQNCSNGGPDGPFCRVLAFSTASCHQLSDLQTNWLPIFTELYNSSIAHLITGHRNVSLHRLCNGMFDRHQAEITAMQFTGNPLPVHQSVTVPWYFNPVPYCQPSSPTPMEYAFLPSLEWHVWRCRRSIYNKTFYPTYVKLIEHSLVMLTRLRHSQIKYTL